MPRYASAEESNKRQDKIAAKYRPRIERAISDAMRAVAAKLPTTGNPEVPITHFREIETALQELYRAITKAEAEALVDKFKAGYLWIETKADLSDFFERIYAEYLTAYGGQKIGQVSEATRSQIIQIVGRGLRDGLTLDEVAATLEAQADGIAVVRAAVIARTETHSASMYASLKSAQRSTIPLVKEWTSIEDHRTRDFGEGDGEVDKFSHRIMDGVQVPIDAAFEVPMLGGLKEPLMFPGDPAGSAANVINCRCAMTYESSDEEPDDVAPPPPTRTPGGPAFRYQTVKPPKATTADIEAWLKAEGIADLVNIKGISPKELAPLVVSMLEVKERFGLEALVAMGPASRFFSRGGRSKALAAIYPTVKKDGRQGLFHMPTTFGDRSKWQKDLDNLTSDWAKARYAKKKDAYLTVRAASPTNPLDPELSTRLQRAESEGVVYPFTIEGDGTSAQTVESYRRGTIYHEYGHVVHLANPANPGMSDDINAFLRSAQPRQNGWGYLVSDYGNSNNNEYVAETFALYMRGDPDQYYRIHPELLSIYQRYDKAAGGKSVRLMGVFNMGTKADDPALTDDAAAIVQEIINTAPEDREKRARQLLAAYTGEDRETIARYVDETIALYSVDNI